jgi:hypothetical protein
MPVSEGFKLSSAVSGLAVATSLSRRQRRRWVFGENVSRHSFARAPSSFAFPAHSSSTTFSSAAVAHKVDAVEKESENLRILVIAS